VAFNDYFSRQAIGYSRFRPRYPAELFELLAARVGDRHRAWDCGTGNGQAAVALAGFFDEVIATDASASQLAAAEAHPRVTYLIAHAERCPLPAGSVDLITVAQALHWFDLERFYGEVRRVAKPGAVLAAWCYGIATISPAVDRVVDYLYSDLVGPYWPAERQVIETRYETLDFPFDEWKAPALEITADLSCDEFLGYLATWSAVQQFIAHQGADPIERVVHDLQAAWVPGQRRVVRWPLSMRWGRVASNG
jgi:SAM-dependent methyltransferase